MKQTYTKWLLISAVTIAPACSMEGGPGEVATSARALEHTNTAPTRVRVPETNYSVYATLEPARANIEQQRALEALGERVKIDEVFGVPSVVWISNENRSAVRSDRHTPSGDMDLPAHAPTAARQILLDHAHLYGLSPADIARAHVDRVHERAAGGVIVSFTQRHGGEDVHGARMNVAMTRQLEPIAITGWLHPWADANAAKKDTFSRDLTTGLLDALGLERLALEAIGEDAGGFTRFQSKDTSVVFRTPARIKPVYFPLPNKLEPAYMVELDLAKSDAHDAAAWSAVVSARDGELLSTTSLIAHQSFSYNVYVDDDDVPWPNPFGDQLKPYIAGAFPEPVAPRLVTLESMNTRGDVWLPAGATTTVGNNVAAYTDQGGRDGFDGDDIIGELSSADTFGYTYDFSLAPGANEAQSRASVVQLFYTINYMHDLFYDHGFDEDAGNAQDDNYGRGGVAGDRMRAEALDFSGTNNANMYTPSDGASPRMQMFEFTSSAVDRVSVLAPVELVGEMPTGQADYPPFFDVTGELVAVNDGDDEGGSGSFADGCQQFVNGDQVTDKIALIDRGSCSFIQKLQNAQEVGAKGVLIINNDTQNPDRVFDMGGIEATITTPAMMISWSNGQALRQAMTSEAVEVRLIALQNQDAALDADIVTHEWGHYLYGRLTQNNGNTLQAGGLNEGNSDFVALLIAAREEDTLQAGNAMFQGAYPMGQYAGHRYWTGTRRLAYSTAMDINPLTFRHISDREPLPPGIFDAVDNSEVHNSGEIWSNAMWECYAALLNKHGFTDGRERMLDYLVAGLKLFPRDTTFMEARDSILAGVRAYDEDDFRTCFFTFAERGMGVGARAPGRYVGGNLGVVESFDVGGAIELANLEVTESASCDNDGILDVGESATISLQVSNAGAESLEGVMVRVEPFSNGNPNIPRRGVSFPEGNQAELPPLDPFGQATVEIEIDLDEALGSDLLSFRVIADHPDVLRPAQLDDGVLVNTDVEIDSATLDDFELGQGRWETINGIPLVPSTGWAIIDDGNSHVWFGTEEEFRTDVYLVSPPLEVAAGADFEMTFEHRHDFEFGQYPWDGGVIEISRDMGATWVDVTDLGADPGYNATIANGATLFGSAANTVNPIADRLAYGGNNPAYPERDTVSMNFGEQLAGTTVLIRFRLGTDEGTGGGGWVIDNLSFDGLANAPFPALIDEEGSCAGPISVAATAPARVNEGDVVTLEVTDELPEASYLWAQESGPTAELTDASKPTATFTAPDVDEQTEVVFSVTGQIAQETASTTVTVIVDPVNSAPTASFTIEGTLDAGETITLNASASVDPEGDSLTYAWAQIGGPGVALSNPTSAKPTFTAPTFDEDVTLEFQLIVTDGALLSAPTTERVTITASEVAPEGKPTDVGDDKKDPDVDASPGVDDEGCSSSPASPPAGPLTLLLGTLASLGLIRRRSR